MAIAPATGRGEDQRSKRTPGDGATIKMVIPGRSTGRSRDEVPALRWEVFVAIDESPTQGLAELSCGRRVPDGLPKTHTAQFEPGNSERVWIGVAAY